MKNSDGYSQICKVLSILDLGLNGKTLILLPKSLFTLSNFSLRMAPKAYGKLLTIRNSYFLHREKSRAFEAEEVFFHELASGKITSEASKVPMSPKMMKNETFSL